MADRMKFLGLVLLLGAMLLGLGRVLARNRTQRNVELFTEMVYSKAYEPLSPNPNFSDGKTERALPVGTVVRGADRFPYGATPEDAARAGEELANPYAPGDAAAVARGEKIYRTFCIVCHGPQGNGDGSVVARGMLPPPSLHADHAKQMKDGQIFHVVTRGQGNMASYAAQIVPEDRWRAILHVRALQARGAP